MTIKKMENYFGINRIIMLACVWICSISHLEAAIKRQRASQGYRLPENIIPQKYNLRINTNLEENNFDFDGTVQIKIQCVKATNKIILHVKELDIIEEGASLKQITVDNDTRDIPIASHQYAKENDFYIVMLNQRLAPGNTYWLSIPFKGTLTEGLAGYYRSSYFDRAANKTKWVSVTQFESTDARRAFPCFDEPAMKATFAISLAHRAHLKAISNMPLIESEPIEGKNDWVLDKFQETVPMSTYLVAFMISEFEYSEAPKTDCKNVTFRIWARKEAIEQVDLAKQVGPKVLAYFEKYFNTDYPLPKQDMAAIPDFNAGAMENWGLITYRETALLYEPQSSSIFNKHSIASVISHELAHQWFGNLVTMKWWTDLWLNEGFATYVGALGVHHVFPEWKSLTSTAINDFLTVLSLDALKTSHPVSVIIGHPSEIDQIFDTISYKKGSYLLRMMNMFLGEDVFRKSVSNYLKKHRYNNAAQDDLWEALTETAHSTGVLDNSISVKMIMDSWTLQTGYPLVTVKRDYKRKSIIVSQERYLSTPMDNKANGNNNNNKNKRESDGCWWVPLSYTTNKDLNFNNTKPQSWLTCNGSVTLPTDAGQDDWVLFNLQVSGLYRVNYDENNWKMLGNVLNDEKQFTKIDTLSRVQLLVDTLGLAWVGKIDYQLAFDLVNYLKYETEYLPWKSALSTIHDISRMLLRTPTFGYFKKFIRDMLEPVYQKRFASISQLPDDFESIKHHSLIVSWSCYYGVLDCQEQTLNLFKSWYTETNPDQNNPIPKDLRSVVYCHRGWCRKRNALLLVYDYMPNGSLNKWIFDKPMKLMNWGGRKRVLADVAEGLNYLHHGWDQVVVHRDIKSSNVLLDSEMRGRLGDFGLAKLYSHGEVPNTTRVVGTLGYLAPEVATLATPTAASDVYSFGVVVLEVACGRRPIEIKVETEDEEVLIDWVRQKYSVGRLSELADKRIKGEYEVEEMEAVLKLGLSCCHPDPLRRPTMKEVIAVLIGENLVMTPKDLLSEIVHVSSKTDRAEGGEREANSLVSHPLDQV